MIFELIAIVIIIIIFAITVNLFGNIVIMLVVLGLLIRWLCKIYWFFKGGKK